MGPELIAKKNFWVSVYSKYSKDQGLIHDTRYPQVVYEVLSLTKKNAGKISNSKEKYRKILLSIHQKIDSKHPLSSEEKRVAELFRSVSEPDKFLRAAHRKRIRFQPGQREEFLRGITYSRKYLNEMETIFSKAGLPVWLTRLPFVESSFNINARSKVGASGIWQFMPSTAAVYLKMDLVTLDERNDPIRATEAAAKLFSENFKTLKSWPLAVTAYNHGRRSIQQAIRIVGSNDLEDLIKFYNQRSFGFASSNFFACLLAAVEVERDKYKYFSSVDIEKFTPLITAEIPLPMMISVDSIIDQIGLEKSELKNLNPGLMDSVWNNECYLPEGYKLRVPVEKAGVAFTQNSDTQSPKQKKHLPRKCVNAS